MKSVLSAAVLAAALTMAGGAALGRTYLASTAEVAKIRVGASSAKEVQALLGEPVARTRDTRRGLDSWEYRVFEFGQRSTLWISFSADGIVREMIQLEQPRTPGAQ